MGARTLIERLFGTGSIAGIEVALKKVVQMQHDGVIGHFALGGAIGATFYLEPVETSDVDIFVSFQNEGMLVDMHPIYTYLLKLGCTAQGEHIVIAGWPVQFLAPSHGLMQEALAEAIPFNVGGVKVHVFRAEHLAAIALKLGRPKDKIRLAQFATHGVMDMARFNTIVNAHGLAERWHQFEQHILRDENRREQE